MASTVSVAVMLLPVRILAELSRSWAPLRMRILGHVREAMASPTCVCKGQLWVSVVSGIKV